MICVGTAALGCPAEQSSAVGILVKCGCSDVFRDRLNSREFRIGNLARQELASVARPDSRGRLSPRESCWLPVDDGYSQLFADPERQPHWRRLSLGKVGFFMHSTVDSHGALLQFSAGIGCRSRETTPEQKAVRPNCRLRTTVGFNDMASDLGE
jgi:hypothetical protein